LTGVPFLYCSLRMTSSTLTIEIAGETLLIHHLKAIFWPREQMLITCDVHVGKIGHFRENGIPLPALTAKNNYWNLTILFETFKPAQLVVIGDLTHSRANAEWADFVDYLDQYPELRKRLVLGNHDVKDTEDFLHLGFEMTDELVLDPFTFVHTPPAKQTQQDGTYYLSGHIHPGVRLVGKGKSSMVIPCFYFGENQGILPAFGAFTGYVPIKPRKEDRIIGITKDSLVNLTNS
jgi:DNA ligase-associated metallophosphoesterase